MHDGLVWSKRCGSNKTSAMGTVRGSSARVCGGVFMVVVGVIAGRIRIPVYSRYILDLFRWQG
jgi:hypothetical protein